jgi:hypothetical protein
VLEALTGTGLAASAGLNAYIPLLTVGLIGRFTDVVDLPEGWRWLENPWSLSILAVLLAVEVVADKVPAVDSINDVLQTVVRPTAGGIVFGATATSDATTVTDSGHTFGGGAWVPIAVGVVLALVVHGGKAVARPVLNTFSGGLAAPVVSTVEDAASLSLSLVALLVPALVVVVLVGFIAFFWWAIRRVRRARRAKRLARRAPMPEPL